MKCLDQGPLSRKGKRSALTAVGLSESGHAQHISPGQLNFRDRWLLLTLFVTTSVGGCKVREGLVYLSHLFLPVRWVQSNFLSLSKCSRAPSGEYTCGSVITRAV